MAVPFGGSYNPMNVMLRHGAFGGTDTSGPVARKPYMQTSTPPPPQPIILRPEAVRATGQGPYDPAYRQDLATYAGGLSQRPGGMLGINPTGQLAGNPTGGGNAPVPGENTDLLSLALGGQSFLAPPAPQVPAAKTKAAVKNPQTRPGNQNFLERYMGSGRYLRDY